LIFGANHSTRENPEPDNSGRLGASGPTEDNYSPWFEICGDGFQCPRAVFHNWTFDNGPSSNVNAPVGQLLQTPPTLAPLQTRSRECCSCDEPLSMTNYEWDAPPMTCSPCGHTFHWNCAIFANACRHCLDDHGNPRSSDIGNPQKPENDGTDESKVNQPGSSSAAAQTRKNNDADGRSGQVDKDYNQTPNKEQENKSWKDDADNMYYYDNFSIEEEGRKKKRKTKTQEFATN
jgi:hypothetical protein